MTLLTLISERVRSERWWSSHWCFYDTRCPENKWRCSGE